MNQNNQSNQDLNNINNTNKKKKTGEKFNFFESGIIFYLLIIAIIVFLGYKFSGGNIGETSKLSDIYTYIESDEYIVDSAVIEGNDITLKYYANGEVNNVKTIQQKVPAIALDGLTQYLQKALKEGKIDSFDYKEPISWGTISSIIFGVLMMIVTVVMITFFFNQRKESGSVFSFGSNRAKLTTPSQMKVKFDDVAGSLEEKEELSEIVDFLKTPKKYLDLGAKIPKGVILYGPPGTGKTLLARAVAGEAAVPFFYISGSDFVEMLVGVGSSRVRSLFADAKKSAPSVVFIDEIDAVGRKRGAGLGGGNDEREQTLNQILVEMDGFDVNTNVIVIAATNRVDVLDPALLRAGRFDRKIMVNPPDADEREAILQVHARGKKFTEEVSFREIALSTTGFTGADLENLLNEAALLTARRNKTIISQLEINDAMFRVMMGPEKNSKKLTEKSKKLTAYHEAGHAVVLRTVSDLHKVDRVTIIPAGSAGGFTAYKPKEDFDYYTKKMCLDSIKTSLGGRAAEEIFLGEVSTGAASDLKHCNNVAKSMIKRYGLSDKFPNLVFGDDNEEVFIGSTFGQVQSYSDKTAADIDVEIKNIIDSCYEDTLRILNEKRNVVEGLAKRLMHAYKVDAEEFEKIYVADGDLSYLKNEESLNVSPEIVESMDETAKSENPSEMPQQVVECDEKSVNETSEIQNVTDITSGTDSTSTSCSNAKERDFLPQENNDDVSETEN